MLPDTCVEIESYFIFIFGVLGTEPGTPCFQNKHSTTWTNSQSLEPFSTMFLRETRVEKAVEEGPQKMPTGDGRSTQAPPIGDPVGSQAGFPEQFHHRYHVFCRCSQPLAE